MAISEKQLEQRRQAGKASSKKRDMVALGKRGGRPTWDVALEKDLRREAEEATRRASRPGRAPVVEINGG